MNSTEHSKTALPLPDPLRQKEKVRFCTNQLREKQKLKQSSLACILLTSQTALDTKSNLTSSPTFSVRPPDDCQSPTQTKQRYEPISGRLKVNWRIFSDAFNEPHKMNIHPFGGVKIFLGGTADLRGNRPLSYRISQYTDRIYSNFRQYTDCFYISMA